MSVLTICSAFDLSVVCVVPCIQHWRNLWSGFDIKQWLHCKNPNLSIAGPGCELILCWRCLVLPTQTLAIPVNDMPALVFVNYSSELIQILDTVEAYISTELVSYWSQTCSPLLRSSGGREGVNDTILMVCSELRAGNEPTHILIYWFLQCNI